LLQTASTVDGLEEVARCGQSRGVIDDDARANAKVVTPENDGEVQGETQVIQGSGTLLARSSELRADQEAVLNSLRRCRK